MTNPPRDSSVPIGRPHHLLWNGSEWTDERCGCRYHPDDDNGTHGGAPHVHPCAAHAKAADALPCKAREVRRFLTEELDALRAVAFKHGYVLAVHGSLARDLDLVAVPWIEEASSADEVADAIRRAAGAEFATTTTGDPQPEGPQAHGRRSWAITLPRHATYIDLSVMPRVLKDGGQ